MTKTAKSNPHRTVKVFDSLTEISKFAADKFVNLAEKAMEINGRFTVSLAGGSTPKPLYELLATDKYKSKIDWEKVYFFLGDERNVPADSEQSNYKMINEAMFEKLPIPEANIFRWRTESKNPEAVAEIYEQSIKEFFGLRNDEFPVFDLILLGMGDDGHTASLFPNTDALNETEKIAVSNHVEKFDTNRLTFTYPTINNARNIVFLVGGENKAEVLKEVLEGEIDFRKLPSQNINSEHAKILWLVDKSAGKELSDRDK